MTTEDKMTIDERRKYLRRMQRRYLQADRKERGRLLDEMEAVIELHRKSLIRLINGNLERTPRQRQRDRSNWPPPTQNRCASSAFTQVAQKARTWYNLSRSRTEVGNLQIYLNIAQILVSVALIVLVLLQAKGAGLGGVFGGEGSVYKSRRGVEKTLFNLTIVFSVLFLLISLLSVTRF